METFKGFAARPDSSQTKVEMAGWATKNADCATDRTWEHPRGQSIVGHSQAIAILESDVWNRTHPT